jgi:hypothetical protein
MSKIISNNDFKLLNDLIMSAQNIYDDIDNQSINNSDGNDDIDNQFINNNDGNDDDIDNKNIHEISYETESMIKTNNKIVDNMDSINEINKQILEQTQYVDKVSKNSEIEFILYTYLSEDNIPGTIICHPDMEEMFDSNVLVKMKIISKQKIKLNDFIENGIITNGDIGKLKNNNIIYPYDPSKKKIFEGKIDNESRELLINHKFNLNFELYPDSELSDSDISDSEL